MRGDGAAGAGGKAFAPAGTWRPAVGGPRGRAPGRERAVVQSFLPRRSTLEQPPARSARGARVGQVSVWDGIVMGGGVGLSVHGRLSCRDGAERLAMPEVAIGLFPTSEARTRRAHARWHGSYAALTGLRPGPRSVIDGVGHALRPLGRRRRVSPRSRNWTKGSAGRARRGGRRRPRGRGQRRGAAGAVGPRREQGLDRGRLRRRDEPRRGPRDSRQRRFRLRPGGGQGHAPGVADERRDLPRAHQARQGGNPRRPPQDGLPGFPPQGHDLDDGAPAASPQDRARLAPAPATPRLLRALGEKELTPGA